MSNSNNPSSTQNRCVQCNISFNNPEELDKHKLQEHHQR
jgi:hypothetical protein